MNKSNVPFQEASPGSRLHRLLTLKNMPAPISMSALTIANEYEPRTGRETRNMIASKHDKLRHLAGAIAGKGATGFATPKFPPPHSPSAPFVFLKIPRISIPSANDSDADIDIPR